MEISIWVLRVLVRGGKGRLSRFLLLFKFVRALPITILGHSSRKVLLVVCDRSYVPSSAPHVLLNDNSVIGEVDRDVLPCALCQDRVRRDAATRRVSSMIRAVPATAAIEIPIGAKGVPVELRMSVP